MRKKDFLVVIGSGIVIGVVALYLMSRGNPGNMGICIACFERDIAGALGLHRASIVQYLRPEIIGILLGALVTALATREFKVKGGSAPVTRFLIGMMVMIGALVFLGCPLRLSLRLGAGDMNALVGLFGFVAGIGAGVLFLKSGFNLGIAKDSKRIDGWILPVIAVVLLALAIFKPVFNPSQPVMFKGKPVTVNGESVTTAPGPIFASKTPEGSKPVPGDMKAPLIISLLGGLAVGVVAHRSRFCFAGGIRDAMLTRDVKLLSGVVALVAVVALGTYFMGSFKFGFANQPIAHSDHLFNFLGMAVVGLGSTMLGGCPLRQLVLSGSGNADSSMSVFGMIAGAAFAQNFVFAAGKLPSGTMGVPGNGKIAVLIALSLLILIAMVNSEAITGRFSKKT